MKKGSIVTMIIAGFACVINAVFSFFLYIYFPLPVPIAFSVDDRLMPYVYSSDNFMCAVSGWTIVFLAAAFVLCVTASIGVISRKRKVK